MKQLEQVLKSLAWKWEALAVLDFWQSHVKSRKERTQNGEGTSPSNKHVIFS
jgi:hypothetical protein